MGCRSPGGLHPTALDSSQWLSNGAGHEPALCSALNHGLAGSHTMASFIIRRLIASIFVLFAATFLMYILTAISGDPQAAVQARSAAEVLISTALG